MSNERFEQLQKMLIDLIGVVGATNSKVSKLAETMEILAQSSIQTNSRLDSIEERLASIEQSMYRLDRIEKCQNKNAARLEEIEADISPLQDHFYS